MFVALCVMSGCYDRFDTPAEGDGEDGSLTSNITIAELHRRLDGVGYVDVVDDLRLVGSVSANNCGGNFYRCFVVESGGYGVTFLDGLDDSSLIYPLGSEVRISLKGLRINRRYGTMQIGVAAADGDYYEVDYLGYEHAVDNYVFNSHSISRVEPREVTAHDLSSSDKLGEFCGSLIRVSGLHLAEDDDGGSWSGSHCFVDCDGGEVWVYTSSYADFSEYALPRGECSIIGILQSRRSDGSGGAVIKMRDYVDCMVE